MSDLATLARFCELAEAFLVKTAPCRDEDGQFASCGTSGHQRRTHGRYRRQDRRRKPRDVDHAGWIKHFRSERREWGKHIKRERKELRRDQRKERKTLNRDSRKDATKLRSRHEREAAGSHAPMKTAARHREERIELAREIRQSRRDLHEAQREQRASQREEHRQTAHDAIGDIREAHAEYLRGRLEESREARYERTGKALTLPESHADDLSRAIGRLQGVATRMLAAVENPGDDGGILGNIADDWANTLGWKGGERKPKKPQGATGGGNCGTGPGGFKPGNTCQRPGQGGKPAATGKPAKKPKKKPAAKPAKKPAAKPPEKPQRAAGERDKFEATREEDLAPFQPVPGEKIDKTRRRYADRQERLVAHELNATWMKDYEPHDGIRKRKGGGTDAIEVKSLIYGKASALSVHANALVRKADDALVNPGRVYHTVALDKRHESEGGEHAGKYSGHEIYYKRACGPYNLSKMHKCKDMDELRQLMEMPDDKLPEAARGAFPKGAALKRLKAKAKKERAYNNERSRDRKAKLGPAAYGRQDGSRTESDQQNS